MPKSNSHYSRIIGIKLITLQTLASVFIIAGSSSFFTHAMLSPIQYPHIDLCILCALSNPTNSTFASLRVHFKTKHHLKKSRMVFLCSECDFAGTGFEVRSHIRATHHISHKDSHNLECIRIPHLCPNQAITQTQMVEYSERLYKLIDDHGNKTVNNPRATQQASPS